VSKGGLEDVVATSSAICWIDGDRGILSYCGFDIHDLAQHATFEEVCFLLWHRRLPTRAELGDLQTQLAEARVLPEPILRLLNQLPSTDGKTCCGPSPPRSPITTRTRRTTRRPRRTARRCG